MHRLTQLSPHTHWLSPYGPTDRPTLGVVYGSRECLLIDSGNSPAHARALKTQLAQHGLRAPTRAMLTHWHWDHVFGTSAFDIPTYASCETARIVRLMTTQDFGDAALDARVAAGSEIAFCRDLMRLELPNRSALVLRPPEHEIRSEQSLDLGGVTCRLIHVGGDHAHDSTIVYVEQDRVAFLGDCVYQDLYHGPRRITPALLLPLLERLLSLDAEYYVQSHHDAPQTRAEFVIEAAQYMRVGAIARAHYPNRAAALSALGESPSTEVLEDLDAFWAGLQRPEVASIW